MAWYNDVLMDVVDGAREIIGSKFDAEVGRTTGEQVQVDTTQYPTENFTSNLMTPSSDYFMVAGKEVPKIAVYVSGGLLLAGLIYKALD
jgi:hypothetical protein